MAGGGEHVVPATNLNNVDVAGQETRSRTGPGYEAGMVDSGKPAVLIIGGLGRAVPLEMPSACGSVNAYRLTIS